MNTTYLIYDEISGAWSNQDYTLEEISLMPEVTDATHICTADGKHTLTLGQARERAANAPAPSIKRHYLVIEHSKSAGAIGGSYDAKGLQAKLNEAASRGYRLVGVCSPTVGAGGQIASSLIGGGASSAPHIQGVVAIMEKEYT